MEESTHDQTEEDSYSSVGNLMDSRTSRLDDELLDRLEDAFHKQTFQVIVHELAKIAADYNPIDLAHAATRLPSGARVVIYENLPELASKVAFLIDAERNTQAAVLREIDDEELRQVIEETSADEAVALLEILPDRRLRKVLETVDIEVARRVRELLQHDRYSAGRLMTSEFFAFSMNATIGDIAKVIRDNPGIELMRHVFVVNEERELQGFIQSRNLIISAPELLLRKVMQPILYKVGPDATREEVIDLVERYKIPALPVVDDGDGLLGVITYEDVVEAMEDVADETIAHMAGTSEDVSEHDPIFKRFLLRAPWLVVTLCAGMTIATGLDHFADRPWFLFVPFFIPLINGMSGNIGIQCSTVLVRSMATGELSSGARTEAIIKELSLGLFTGGVFGFCCGLLVYLLSLYGVYEIGSDPLVIGVMVTSGILSACCVSTFLGVFSPFLFARIGVDPAVASGPIVTAFNDTLSTFSYCFVAFVIMKLFY